MALGDSLRDLHLADLHERASELGVRGYRMLERDELIEAIEDREREGGLPSLRTTTPSAGEEKAPERAPPAPAPRRASPGGAARQPIASRSADGDDSDEADDDPGAEEVETEEVTGVLDRMPQGYGFLRLSGLSAHEGDVYVSASQIRRCELRPGDEVSGPARAPRRGERHRALVRVATVNGQEPEGKRVQFEDLTAVAPHRRIELGEA